MKTKLPFIIIFFCFVVLNHAAAFALDDLYLCGTVQQIDRAKSTVTIEVISSSCPGVQTFKLPNKQTGKTFNVGEMKCFVIDSNQCSDGLTHRIIEMKGE